MAVKNNELRIGNFVQDEHGIVQYVYRLWQGGAELAKDESGCENLDHTNEEIFGVPITDECLERAGFEMLPKWTDKKRDGATAFLDLGYLNISKNMMGGITLCDNQGLSTGVHIDYVHELQNIHFDLKGTELVFKKIDDND